jgi:hypothetical protein
VAFSLCGLKSVSKKTIIYIDGYNLYYSRLKNTPFKWLDVVALFRDQILMPQDPTAEVVAVKPRLSIRRRFAPTQCLAVDLRPF